MGWIDGCAFDLPEEALLLQESARHIAKAELLPKAAEVDRAHRFPKEVVKRLAAEGFLGALIPEEYGGVSMSYVAYCLIVEELAAACASTAIIISAHNSLCAAPIALFGTEEQKKKFLPDLASGKSLGCLALSEPGAGSDAASIRCAAKFEEGHYVVSGSKNWITNGAEADTCVLFAKTDPAGRHQGVSAFVHPLDLPGITRGKPEDKLGICASSTTALNFEDVALQQELRLGAEGDGFRIAMETLNGGRLGVAAQAIGIARAALAAALGYAQGREAFGKLIARHQTIQNYFADMVTELDAARYLTLGAATLLDRGERYARQAAMAKLYASEMSHRVTHKALQVFGGYGFVKDYPVERHARDARITEIYEGTSEIQRLVIASQLLQEVSLADA